MFQQSSYSEKLTFFQKLRSFDYVLLLSILILGVISNLSMYSTDGGEFLYHTKSHLLRFVVFFTLMVFLSFRLLKWKNKRKIKKKIIIKIIIFFFI